MPNVLQSGLYISSPTLSLCPTWVDGQDLAEHNSQALFSHFDIMKGRY